MKDLCWCNVIVPLPILFWRTPLYHVMKDHYTSVMLKDHCFWKIISDTVLEEHHGVSFEQLLVLILCWKNMSSLKLNVFNLLFLFWYFFIYALEYDSFCYIINGGWWINYKRVNIELRDEGGREAVFSWVCSCGVYS